MTLCQYINEQHDTENTAGSGQEEQCSSKFISLEPNYPTLEEQILRSTKAAASVILLERPVTWSTS